MIWTQMMPLLFMYLLYIKFCLFHYSRSFCFVSFNLFFFFSMIFSTVGPFWQCLLHHMFLRFVVYLIPSGFLLLGRRKSFTPVFDFHFYLCSRMLPQKLSFDSLFFFAPLNFLRELIQIDSELTVLIQPHECHTQSTVCSVSRP